MSIKVNTSLLMEILESTPANHNIMLMGKHGIGKSEILENFFTAKGFKVVTLFLGQMSDPGDLIGIPRKNEATGKTEFLPPFWFPTDDIPVVLFLDELNRARPEVLQTIMDLALNRKLAGRTLPEGSRIISAVNAGEEYQLTELDPALVSRFNIYEFEPSVSDWIDWAEKNDVDERIIDFIKAEPNMLDNHKIFDSMEGLEKSADRRGWVRASEIIKGVQELNDAKKAIVAGIVGSNAANNFWAWMENNNILSAGELFSKDFEDSLKKLNGYSTPEFVIINNDIFDFLEKNDFGDLDQKKMAKNLASYYETLERRQNREAIAHFANMFAGTDYPNALIFIMSECNEMYAKIVGFVKEIK